MEDMAGKISELLSDPGTLQQIMSLTSMLGGDSEETTNALPPPQKNEPPPQEEEETSLLSGDMMQTMLRLAPLLGNLNQEDDTSRLLQSLRPFLSEGRREKLDQANKILQLLKILPVIKELNF